MWQKHQCFVVMADNGESWEDYREGRLGIFYKKEDAELYLSNAGWKKGTKYWHKVEQLYGWETECQAWIEEADISF